MPGQVAQPAGNQNQQPQRGGQNIVATVLRLGLMWYMMSWFKGGNQQASSDPAAMSNPLYRRGDLVDMYVYLSEEPYLRDRSSASLIWQEPSIALAASPERQFTYTYQPSKVRGNCVHVCL